mgnify:FL=1|tara:strand:- start:205 stop:1458 length:1254 start_codon:yes stop_codon:yes gene_type:complete
MRITLEQIDGYLDTKKLRNSQSQKSVLVKFQTLFNQIETETIEQVFNNRYRIQIRSKKTLRNQKSIVMGFNDFVNGKVTIQSTQEVRKIVKVEPQIRMDVKNVIIKDIMTQIQKEATMNKPDFEKISKFSYEQFVPRNPKYTFLEGEEYFIQEALIRNQAIWTFGGAGGGKSTMYQQYAYQQGIAIVRIGCSMDLDKEDLIYSKTIDLEGNVKYELSGIGLGFALANWLGCAIVILDEMNTLSQYVQKNLNSFTDDLKFADVNGLGRIQLNEGCKLLIVGTGNIGYSGVQDLNPELRSRCFPYKKQQASDDFIIDTIWKTDKDVPRIFKEKLLRISKAIQELQKTDDISEKATFMTREPKQILSFYGSISEKELLENGIVNRFYDNEDDQNAVRKIVSSIMEWDVRLLKRESHDHRG